MKIRYWLLIVILVSLPSAVCEAQTYVATRGTRQFLIGNRLFQMEDNVDYRVVGKSPSGGPLILTPVGVGDCGFSGRFRVLPGGVYAKEPTVILKDAEAITGVNPGSPSDPPNYHHSDGYYPLRSVGRDPFLETTFKGELISPTDLTHVYVAYQWYVDDKAVATETQFVGTVKANTPIHLSLSIELATSQKSGNYTIHIYSGYNELKQRVVKMGETW